MPRAARARPRACPRPRPRWTGRRLRHATPPDGRAQRKRAGSRASALHRGSARSDWSQRKTFKMWRFGGRDQPVVVTTWDAERPWPGDPTSRFAMGRTRGRARRRPPACCRSLWVIHPARRWRRHINTLGQLLRDFVSRPLTIMALGALVGCSLLLAILRARATRRQPARHERGRGSKAQHDQVESAA